MTTRYILLALSLVLLFQSIVSVLARVTNIEYGVDDEGELWVNGVSVHTGARFANKYVVSADLNDNSVIAVKGTNTGGLAGIMVSFTYDGIQYVSSGAWKCTGTDPSNSNWLSPIYAMDSSWVSAVEQGSQPGWTINGMISTAKFIWHRQSSNAEKSWCRFLMPHDAAGIRFVTLRGSVGECLNVAQVQVFDMRNVDVARNPQANVTVTATASSVGTNIPSNFGPANFVLDNNLNTCYHSQCGASDPNPWLKIDLGMEYSLSHVIVTNRQDCCTTRLVGAYVQMTDASGNIIHNSPPLTADTAPQIIFPYRADAGNKQKPRAWENLYPTGAKGTNRLPTESVDYCRYVSYGSTSSDIVFGRDIWYPSCAIGPQGGAWNVLPPGTSQDKQYTAKGVIMERNGKFMFAPGYGQDACPLSSVPSSTAFYQVDASSIRCADLSLSGISYDVCYQYIDPTVSSSARFTRCLLRGAHDWTPPRTNDLFDFIPQMGPNGSYRWKDPYYINQKTRPQQFIITDFGITNKPRQWTSLRAAEQNLKLFDYCRYVYQNGTTYPSCALHPGRPQSSGSEYTANGVIVESDGIFSFAKVYGPIPDISVVSPAVEGFDVLGSWIDLLNLGYKHAYCSAGPSTNNKPICGYGEGASFTMTPDGDVKLQLITTQQTATEPSQIQAVYSRTTKKRPNVKYLGFPELSAFAGWVDLSGVGHPNDYCRFIDQSPPYVSCKLAGSPDPTNTDAHPAFWDYEHTGRDEVELLTNERFIRTPKKQSMDNSITDLGISNKPSAWTNVQELFVYRSPNGWLLNEVGLDLDYCRFVDANSMYASCAFAGSTNQYSKRGVIQHSSSSGFSIAAAYRRQKMVRANWDYNTNPNPPASEGTITDIMPELPHGWFDVQGIGVRNDFCRYILSAGVPKAVCAMAGSTNQYSPSLIIERFGVFAYAPQTSLTITDIGYPNQPRAWVQLRPSVTPVAESLDFCRFVGDPAPGWPSCAMAGTNQQYTAKGYIAWSTERGFYIADQETAKVQDYGLEDRVSAWVDLAGSGAARDYCRYINPADPYVSCVEFATGKNTARYTVVEVGGLFYKIPGRPTIPDNELGLHYRPRAWVDLQQLGSNNDYCRYVVSSAGGTYAVCTLAGEPVSHNTQPGEVIENDGTFALSPFRRQTSATLTDMGIEGSTRGWYDLHGTGYANSYCRYIIPLPEDTDRTPYPSCALTGSTKQYTRRGFVVEVIGDSSRGISSFAITSTPLEIDRDYVNEQFQVGKVLDLKFFPNEIGDPIVMSFIQILHEYLKNKMTTPKAAGIAALHDKISHHISCRSIIIQNRSPFKIWVTIYNDEHRTWQTDYGAQAPHETRVWTGYDGTHIRVEVYHPLGGDRLHDTSTTFERFEKNRVSFQVVQGHDATGNRHLARIDRQPFRAKGKSASVC